MENHELTPLESPVETVPCSNCQTPVAAHEVYCSNCGFPQNGDDEERAKFQRRITAKKNLLKEVKREVKKGKNTLIVLGVLNGLVAIFYGFVQEDILAAVIQAILGVVYLGLSLWVDKQPFGALLSALILYLTIILLLAIAEPLTIFSGIIWKVLIIGFLVRGIKSGHEASKIYKELDELGIERK